MFELLCELQTICDDIFYGCGFSKKKKSVEEDSHFHV